MTIACYSDMAGMAGACTCSGSYVTDRQRVDWAGLQCSRMKEGQRSSRRVNKVSTPTQRTPKLSKNQFTAEPAETAEVYWEATSFISASSAISAVSSTATQYDID